MKKINFPKVLAVVGNALLILLIIIGILIAFSLLPIKNNYKILVVTSGSMEPTIGAGSLAIIKPSADYNVGDIITFKKSNASSDKETTTHRIIETSEINGSTFYKTKGDANKNADTQLVNRDQIVGKYYFSIALLGYLIKYLKTLPGLIFLIIIPATIIIYEEARKIGKEMRNIRAKKKLNISSKKESK